MSKRTFEYEILWLTRKAKRKISRKPWEFSHYAGKDIIPLQDANDLIRQQILAQKPFMAARYGGTETDAAWVFDSHIAEWNLRKMKSIAYKMDIKSGFFSNDIIYLKRFSDLIKESSQCVDLLGVWFMEMEDYMIEQYAQQCILTRPRALEPWYIDNPWTASLKGKKVLIIHPFEDTIHRQYERREKLFPGTEILPEFADLYTVKAVQTMVGERDKRFKDWFEALEWMYEEAVKFDFDVAIIGCGAYGFPLAAKLKKAGRIAVHMGGATQILFGIKGNRWEQHPVIGKLYNEYWVRPNENETPRNAGINEGACYW